jgi:hypothetical protein
MHVRTSWATALVSKNNTRRSILYQSQLGHGPLGVPVQERRVGVVVAAVEAGVLLEPLLGQRRPGPAHHLPVAHRRRVRLAVAATTLNVRGRLVRLAPAQQDPLVGPRRRAVVAEELGAGVGAEEREEVVAAWWDASTPEEPERWSAARARRL